MIRNACTKVCVALWKHEVLIGSHITHSNLQNKLQVTLLVHKQNSSRRVSGSNNATSGILFKNIFLKCFYKCLKVYQEFIRFIICTGEKNNKSFRSLWTSNKVFLLLVAITYQQVYAYTEDTFYLQTIQNPVNCYCFSSKILKNYNKTNCNDIKMLTGIKVCSIFWVNGLLMDFHVLQL